MALRTSTKITLQVGYEGSLDEKVIDAVSSDLLDTLDKATHVVGTLAASEANTPIDFGDVTQCRLLYVEADGDINLTVGGQAATAGVLTGSGGTYPTGFGGTETLLVTIDATPLTITFDDLDETLAQVINRINSVAALSGLAAIASDFGGELRLTSPTTGSSSIVNITGGTGLVTLGLTVTSNTGTAATAGTSETLLRRLSTDTTLKTYALLTVQTNSLTVSNPDTANSLRYRIAIVGDIVTT